MEREMKTKFSQRRNLIAHDLDYKHVCAHILPVEYVPTLSSGKNYAGDWTNSSTNIL